MKARVTVGGVAVDVDLSHAIDLSLPVAFGAEGPRHFGAPAAETRPFAVDGFSGAVASGASCNCRWISLIPHCHGTHTESVGHLTTAHCDAWRLVPPECLPTLLLTVAPVAADRTTETTEPAPLEGDRLITAEAIEAAWARAVNSIPEGIAIHAVVLHRPSMLATAARVPPYLTREAAALLVERSIDHLLVDLPSIDRTHDEGWLTAHRVFFGMPSEGTKLDSATRANATITEFVRVPNGTRDGFYLLSLQVPAIDGDAVPSRPLLYPLEEREGAMDFGLRRARKDR